MTRGPLTLVASLLIASILATPNPRYEWTRLTSGSAAHRLPTVQVLPSVRDATAAAAYAERAGMTLGYFGAFPNYVELMTGVRSVSLFNNPWDMSTGVNAVQMGCDRIIELDPDLLVVGDMGVLVFSNMNNILCRRYELSTGHPGVRDWYLAQRVGG